MAIESTAKMLAKMAGNKHRDNSISMENKEIEALAEPQLTPSNQMEHILANMLGSGYDQSNTILD